MKKIFILSLVIILGSLAGACNTIKGIGQDIEGAGKSLQRTSDY